VTVTLQALFDVDVDMISASADAWKATAADLDAACENLIRSSRDLESVWPDGPAAEAATTRTRDTRNEAANAYPRCVTVARALREYADTLRSLQNHLRDIAAEATRAGFRVDIGAGTVAAPQHMYDAAGSGAYTVAQRCSSYMWQLDGLVSQAVDVDTRTTATINANLPDTRAGFGSAGSRPLTLAEVQAQNGRRPTDVNAWWTSLTAEQQQQVLRDYPQQVGWLDGVPADDRDAANRSYVGTQLTGLQSEEDRLRARLAQLPGRTEESFTIWRRLQDIDGEQVKLGEVTTALDRLDPQGLLLGVDAAGDGKVVIAVGNPDTADHTAVWAPGLGTTVQGATADNVDRMLALNEAAGTHTDPGETVSTVYWLGYDAPELGTVAFEERSRAGGPAYLNFVDSMRATHEGAGNHLTAMGHSYGSTIVGEAARTGGLPVDDIIVQGSPGMHVDHATGLHLDPSHVWAGASDSDPVSGTTGVHKGLVVGGAILGGPVGALAGDWVGAKYADGHSNSPHYQEFGANKYHVDTAFHTSYWERGSESLDNQAAIIAGDYAAVGLDHGKKPENN
jgi:hypothetical protein